MHDATQLEHWPLDRPRPYPGNPRANDGAVERLAGLIAEYGFRVPLVVDADGVIITGHTRLKAAEHLGLDTVPVLVAADLSPEQARAWRIADNASAGWSDWDIDRLAVEVGDLEALGLDLTLTGLDEGLLAELTAPTLGGTPTPGSGETSDEKIVTCPKCGTRFARP